MSFYFGKYRNNTNSFKVNMLSEVKRKVTAKNLIKLFTFSKFSYTAKLFTIDYIVFEVTGSHFAGLSSSFALFKGS